MQLVLVHAGPALLPADQLYNAMFLQVQQRPVHFDQLTVNRYEPGEGIHAHVDLLRFDDGVAILSLGSSAVMSFTRGVAAKRILLEPGDLILLEDEARCAQYSGSAPACMLCALRRFCTSESTAMCRYAWRHGIAAVHAEEHEGETIPRGCRTSVTFRKLLPDQ